MHEVFISYARADSGPVDELVAGLTERGVPHWIDRRDIPVSLSWLAEVRRAIEASDLVAVWDTASWRASAACMLESEIAEELGKRVVVLSGDPVAAVEHLCLRYSSRDPADTALSELLVRGGDWDRAGRPQGGLADWRLLARLHRAERHRGRLGLPSVVREFLIVSRRRGTRRAFWAGFGATVILIAASTAFTARTSYLREQRNLADLARNAHQSAEGRRLPESDVYLALRQAVDRAADGRSDHGVRERLVNALAEPVPESSVPVEEAAGFVSAVVDGRAGAVTAPGRRYVASDDGRVGVLYGGGVRASVRIRGARATAPCPGGTQAAVSAEGDDLVVAEGRAICGWRPRERRPEAFRIRGRGEVSAIATSGRVRAVGMTTGAVFLEREGRIERLRPPRPLGGVTRLAVDRTGEALAVADRSRGVVEVYDLRTGALHRAVSVEGLPGALAFGPDKRMLAVGVGGQVHVLDLSNGLTRTVLRGSPGTVGEIAWSADGGRIQAISDRRRMSEWSWLEGTVLRSEPGTWFVALTGPDRRGRGMAVSQAGEVTVLDLDSGRVLHKIRTGAEKVLTAASSRDGERVALGTTEGLILVLDLGSGRVHRHDQPSCVVTGLAFSGDRRLYVACAEGNLLGLDAERGELFGIVSEEWNPASLALAEDGTVFVGTRQGRILAYPPDLVGGKTIHTDVNAAAFRTLVAAPDGGTLYVGGDGGTGLGQSFVLRRGPVWRADHVFVPAAQSTQVRVAAVHEGTGVMAFGLPDGAVQTFTVSDGVLGLRHPGFLGGVRGLAFSTDGAYLTAVTREGVILRFPACSSCVSIRDLVESAGDRLRKARAMGLTDS